MLKVIFQVFLIVSGLTFSFAQEYTPEQLTGKVEKVKTDELSGLLPEVAEAFEKMAAAAAEEGIELKVVSGFRSYDRQSEIWNAKYKEYRKEGYTPPEAVEKIVEYSTIPGTSRHHWGTDIDIIDEAPGVKEKVLDPDKFGEGGPFFKMKQWMDAHAGDFGFVLVYTNDARRKGFHYEPWHYSYAPVAVPMLKAYLQLDLSAILSTKTLLGGQILSQRFMEQYRKEQIMDVNPVLID